MVKIIIFIAEHPVIAHITNPIAITIASAIKYLSKYNEYPKLLTK